MSTLSELLGLMPTDTPEEAYYARPLLQLGQTFSGEQIPYNAEISPGQRFALEAGKGFAGTLSSMLGTRLASDAQREVNAQKLKQARELIAEDSARAIAQKKAELQQEGLNSLYLAAAKGEADMGAPEFQQVVRTYGGVPLSAALAEESLPPGVGGVVGEYKLPEERPTRLTPKDQREVEKQRQITGAKEEGKDWGRKMPAADQSQMLQVPKVAAQAELLAKEFDGLNSSWAGFHYRKNFSPGSRDFELSKNASLWAQEATRLVDVGALTEGDKRTLKDIAEGTFLSTPDDIAKMLRSVTTHLRQGMFIKLGTAKNAYTKGGDAVLGMLSQAMGGGGDYTLPQSGQDLMNRQGVPLGGGGGTPQVPPGMRLEVNRKTGQTRLVPNG